MPELTQLSGRHFLTHDREQIAELYKAMRAEGEVPDDQHLPFSLIPT
jgi:hypothetical protein